MTKVLYDVQSTILNDDSCSPEQLLMIPNPCAVFSPEATAVQSTVSSCDVEKGWFAGRALTDQRNIFVCILSLVLMFVSLLSLLPFCPLYSLSLFPSLFYSFPSFLSISLSFLSNPSSIYIGRCLADPSKGLYSHNNILFFFLTNKNYSQGLIIHNSFVLCKLFR